ncbi:hypothetical protein SAY87_010183 [Trapa incisa]|uniref:Zinc finger A20 and AN1 domain-containing stress-associated protein 5 n=1 Tax=Trapa incisa TaxID=236973 RepID=A0AAN7JAP6_9MYRT|nr:hypothetical protein SAY87_010183 [Trapa incisa]
MAQRTEKEETEFKVPETLTPCINNCGVTGNPATKNMCQKCFNATTSSSTSSSSSNPAASTSNSTAAVATGGSSVINFSAENNTRSTPSKSPDRSGSRAVTIRKQVQASTRMDESTARREVNRCSGCRKKVGLTGFRCRCGELFCADHRYSDRHDCSYDYKAAGREAIARENPVVRAAKIVRV